MTTPALRPAGFTDGLVLGFVCAALLGVAAVWCLHAGGIAPLQREPGLALAQWVSANLGWSTPVFAVLAVLFAVTLARLRTLLAAGAEVTGVAQADHLSDLWTSLFFGVGVIWTAIGMRGSLLFALGDPGEVQSAGAFAVLQRMVDGGILLALSTTIVGGVGGYVMRTLKAITVGDALKRCYAAHALASARRIEDTLRNIETGLHAVTQSQAANGAQGRVAVTLESGRGAVG